MAPSRRRSFVELGDIATLPVEYNATEFENEVLRTGGQTEALFDEALTLEAQQLGITPAARHSLCASPTTINSNHARTGSTDSIQSVLTALTSNASTDRLGGPETTHMRKRASYRRSLSFSEYEQFLAQMDTRPMNNVENLSPPKTAEPSLFSVSTRRSYQSIRNGIKARFRLRRSKQVSSNDSISCIFCRESFKDMKALHTLPCQHNCCEACIRGLVSQATVDETKMPPQCCSQSIPSTIIKGLLNREEQDKFMKAVWLCNTPWEARIFCPDTACGEFIPKRAKIDPKHPFEVACRKCRSRACSICKGPAHAVGQDCPADWELDVVTQVRENSSWRRCYNCINLVEVAHGCTHIICQCKAEFCYHCGAVWDSMAGCPNNCSNEEELERRQQQEEANVARLETERLAREEAARVESEEKLAAEKRTKDSEQLNSLRAQQINERDRLCAFERKMKWMMWTRHGQLKLQILDKYDKMQAAMKERHFRTTNQLEDRQVGAEMELRVNFKQMERVSVLRLRHMEAYCEGLGMSGTGNPRRNVTERDLIELGRQYNIRDNLERLHQSKINVMRDKQAKQMEALLLSQETESMEVGAKQAIDLGALDESIAIEEDGLATLFDERKKRMSKRWLLTEEIERKKLEVAHGVPFAPLETLDWPLPKSKDNGILEDVAE